MQKVFHFLIHVLQKLNYKFKELLIFQNITNNLQDVFSNYKGVTRSLYPAMNVPERVEVSNKTTHPKLAIREGEALPRGKM